MATEQVGVQYAGTIFPPRTTDHDISTVRTTLWIIYDSPPAVVRVRAGSAYIITDPTQETCPR